MGPSGLFVWFAIMICMFFGFNAICENYFVPLIEGLTKDMSISDDVAGATLLAAASSTPELCTALCGLFRSERDDPGPGTIVGSVAFNSTIMIAVAAFASPHILTLNTWSLFRNSSFCAVAIALLLLFLSVITPDQIDSGESAVLVLLYIIYALSMVFDSSVQRFCSRFWPALAAKPASKIAEMGLQLTPLTCFSHANGHDDDPDMNVSDSDLESDFDSYVDVCLNDPVLDVAVESSIGEAGEARGILLYNPENESEHAAVVEEYIGEETSHGDSCVFSALKNMLVCGSRCWMVILTRIMPKLEERRSTRKSIMMLLLCTVWITAISFLNTDAASKAGACLGMNMNVIGLTILSAGSSIPDMLTSLYIVKSAHADMAVSNALGSSIFDICLGLGLPWMLDTLLFSSEAEHLQTALVIPALLGVLAVILLSFAAIRRSNMRLSKRMGVILVLTYVGFVASVIRMGVASTTESF